LLVQSDLVEARWLQEGESPLLREYLLAPVNSVYPVAALGPEVQPLGLYPQRFGARELESVRRHGEAWVMARLVFPTNEWARTLQGQLLGELRKNGVNCEVTRAIPLRGVLVLHLTCRPS
jgi:hypothetical protein